MCGRGRGGRGGSDLLNVSFSSFSRSASRDLNAMTCCRCMCVSVCVVHECVCVCGGEGGGRTLDSPHDHSPIRSPSVSSHESCMPSAEPGAHQGELGLS